ncbi:Uncharacterized protein SCF082_LOCUS32708 [Durusdinium trenchii]|uniref:Transmembrane protein n=1 Tax=Durusdinium trenchii TaxID=1381693 RepID=A0ABP0NGV0_9DINO
MSSQHSDERSSIESSSIQGHTVGHRSSWPSIDLEEDVPEEAGYSVAEPAQPNRTQRLVALIAKMTPTNPDILRAAPVAKVISCLGRVFWATDTDFFHLSHVTEDYDEFLSHSWHVESWKKVLLLLMLKNGPASVLFGSLAAVLMLILWYFQILPSVIKRTPGPAGYMDYSFWCFSAAVVVALLMLILWRPRGRIFVDRVCINQADGRMKAEGILNIGAMLKRSSSLLVIWDESYVDRLWCIFELAAFLQSHPEASAKAVQVRPVLLGFAAASTAVAIILASIAFLFVPLDSPWVVWSILCPVVCGEGYVLIWAFRNYFRALESANRSLQHFRLQTAHCWCCSVDHVNPSTGQSIAVCDREIVRQCVTTWFGSEDAFDETVRSSVKRALAEQLGVDAFPYVWVVSSTVPLIWVCMDATVSIAAEEHERILLAFMVLRCLAWWLWGIPIVATLGLTAARRFHAPGRSCVEELGKNLLVLLVVAPGAALLMAWHVGLELAFGWFATAWLSAPQETLGSVVFAAGCFVAFVLVRIAYRCANRRYMETVNAST